MLKQHSEFFKNLMLVNDILFLSLAWWLSYLLRFHTPIFPAPEPYVFQHYVLAWLLVVVIWAAVFKFADLYRPRRISTHVRETLDIIKGSFLALLIFLGVIFLFRTLVLSRIVVVLFWGLSVVCLNLSHVAFREGLRFLRRRGFNLRHVLVVGSPSQARQLMDQLQGHRQFGLHVVGVYLTEEGDPTDEPEKFPVMLGSLQEALQLVRSGKIDQVFITLPVEKAGDFHRVRDLFGDEPVTLHFVPDMSGLFSLRGKVEALDGLYIVTLQDSPLYGWNSLLKRALDFCVGGAALLIFSPLMALIALAIRGTSSGPVLFCQERMGLDGERFRMLKFRTMVDSAEEPAIAAWTAPEDARVTRVGRLLRRTSLDELPQLFNVIKGEMSLVGPRPERPPLVEEFRRLVPKYMLRHKVKAGMTGWAQVNGWRGSTSLEKRIEHDIYYIENWSLWFDLKILFLSLFRGFLNKNAY